jgi:hypothetical protein
MLLFFALLSCRSPQFSTANNMRNVYGQVYLKDGTTLDGEITVNLESSFGGREYIKFRKREDKNFEKIPINDIDELAIRNEYYKAKYIDFGFSGDRLRFLKRLTKRDSKIQFYEFYRRETNTRNYSNGGTYTTEENSYSYFIETSNNENNRVWNIEGRRVVPNFEDKVSEIVKDCTTLSDKIKQKQKGYFYAQISLGRNKKIDTWMTIIDEYNTCR